MVNDMKRNKYLNMVTITKKSLLADALVTPLLYFIFFVIPTWNQHKLSVSLILLSFVMIPPVIVAHYIDKLRRMLIRLDEELRTEKLFDVDGFIVPYKVIRKRMRLIYLCVLLFTIMILLISVRYATSWHVMNGFPLILILIIGALYYDVLLFLKYIGQPNLSDYSSPLIKPTWGNKLLWIILFGMAYSIIIFKYFNLKGHEAPIDVKLTIIVVWIIGLALVQRLIITYKMLIQFYVNLDKYIDDKNNGLVN